MAAPRKLFCSRRQASAQLPVIGLEAEFTFFVGEEKRAPEEVFGTPQDFVRARMLPRKGRSFQLPSGGAVYFDTGVIEVATPIIEIEPGCCVRAGRTLWEQIECIREELTVWERVHRTRVRLEGFSTHYNVSVPADRKFDAARMRALARLLTYLLHPPVMLLATNRLSTGVGVRPRGNRLEVTADFTPDPDLMIAAASLITGVVLAVIDWPSHDLAELDRRGFPRIAGFRPRKHTSRQGFLARFECFPRNPFEADVNAPDWLLADGRTRSLRQIAREISRPFRRAIRAVTDDAAYAHIFEVLDGRARSLLDFSERPPRYEDAGRVIDWNRRCHRTLPRSRYERIIHRILTHRPIRVGPFTYHAERMVGWYEIAFRNDQTGHRRVFTLDDLAAHCAL